jgi:hypothetical protein
VIIKKEKKLILQNEIKNNINWKEKNNKAKNYFDE